MFGSETFKVYHLVLFVIWVLGVAVALFLDEPYAAVFLAVYVFASWDAIGYGEMIESTGHEYITPFYRVLQIAFQVALSAVLLTASSVYTMVAFNVAWWFGCCDLYYYVFREDIHYVWDEENMYWLWWTPMGLLGIKMSGKLLILQSIIGLILSFCIIRFGG